MYKELKKEVPKKDRRPWEAVPELHDPSFQPNLLRRSYVSKKPSKYLPHVGGAKYIATEVKLKGPSRNVALDMKHYGQRLANAKKKHRGRYRRNG